MIRTLQTVNGINVDASKKAKVAMKRGSFVKVDELAGQVDLAADLATCTGIAFRDTVVTQDLANGYAISEYDSTQDNIAIGEFLGVRPLTNNERFATTEYGTLTDPQAAAGQFLTISAGKLVTSGSATSIVSLGWVYDAGINKLLGFKIVK